MHSILVKDYMQRTSHAISSTATTTEVVARLLKSGMTGIPVIDEQETVVGFVSEQDCIKELLNGAFFCDKPPSVTTIMTKEVLTVTANTSIVELAQTMLREKPKNFPVVSEGKLVGIITRRHILKALIESDEDCYLKI